MKVYRSFTPSSGECGFRSAVTLGTFDGVHLGHRRILERVVARSRADGIESVVVTFDRHPASVLRKAVSPGLLTALDEKLDLFRESGIDRVYVLHFTREVAETPADTFIRDQLVRCFGMRHFVVGYDHGFGRNREVTTERLREYSRDLGFDLEITEPVVCRDMVVKSSVIRSMIRQGDVRTAAELLGREYTVCGHVVHGEGLGRQIGIPTANITADSPEKILPGQGVYAGWGEAGNIRTPGVISIGPRPTFDITEETIEIHLPGYSGDLYGARMCIGFTARLRDIERFESREALVKRIQLDIAEAKKITVK